MGQELSNCCKKDYEIEPIVHPTNMQAISNHSVAVPYDINGRVNGIAGTAIPDSVIILLLRQRIFRTHQLALGTLRTSTKLIIISCRRF